MCNFWRKAIRGFFLCCLAAVAHGQSVTNDAPIEVVAGRIAGAPWQASGWDGNAFFDSVPLLAIRRQGTHGAQGDVSVRGGSFQNSGLLLQGVALRNAQTEHFQGDFTLPSSYLATPEIVTGLERFSRSYGHPAGAVAADLSLLADRGRATVGFGSYQRHMMVEQGMAAVPQSLLPGWSLFGGYDYATRTDGLDDNYLRRRSFGGRTQWLLDDDAVVDLLASRVVREFGARGFYGTPRALPSEEEVAQALLMASYRRGKREERDFDRLSAVWQRGSDSYWYYGRAAGKPGKHRSDLLALHGEVMRPYDDQLALLLRADLGADRIRSRTLGDHERATLSLAALPTYTLGNLTLTAGGAFECFDGDKPGWLPAAGLELLLEHDQKLSLNYSEALRLPSYTELQYNNPTSLGNSGLERQHTRTLDAGWSAAWDGSDVRLGGFIEQGCNTVDWLRTDRYSTTYRATNLDDLWRRGVTSDITIGLNRRVDFHLATLHQWQTTKTSYYASRYVMDYVRHDLQMELIYRLYQEWELRFSQRVQQMDDNPLRRGSDWRYLSGLETRWQPARLAGVRLTLGVANALNREFEVFVGQPEAGRRFYLLAEYAW